MENTLKLIGSKDNRFAKIPINGIYDDNFDSYNRSSNLLSLMMINNSLFDEGLRLASRISDSKTKRDKLSLTDISEIIKLLQFKRGDIDESFFYKLDLGQTLKMSENEYKSFGSNINKILNLLSMILGICKALFDKGQFAKIASNIQRIINIISSSMTFIDDKGNIRIKDKEKGLENLIKNIGKDAIINAIPIDESAKTMIRTFI